MESLGYIIRSSSQSHTAENTLPALYFPQQVSFHVRQFISWKLKSLLKQEIKYTSLFFTLFWVYCYCLFKYTIKYTSLFFTLFSLQY